MPSYLKIAAPVLVRELLPGFCETLPACASVLHFPNFPVVETLPQDPTQFLISSKKEIIRHSCHSLPKLEPSPEDLPQS